MYSFPYLEAVCCSMSSSNCCFLTCIQVSQEAGQVVWYSHLFKNFPQFVVIHTVKGFGLINKAEVDVFLELSYFFDDPMDVGNLISGSSGLFETQLVHLVYILKVASNSFATPWTVAYSSYSVHGILQARILKWVVIPFSRGSSRPRD